MEREACVPNPSESQYCSGCGWLQKGVVLRLAIHLLARLLLTRAQPHSYLSPVCLTPFTLLLLFRTVLREVTVSRSARE
ncbi:hypothetical protein E2C01_017657 [Portunus trituberculatus]|uniref:Uncharacterized protein n=1 Tax=Portunus trituberculatus TaxID=210409 RepID=A0A5B7DSD9_PORTR|nr:hypothetical protein [Portunus trituberculatus]